MPTDRIQPVAASASPGPLSGAAARTTVVGLCRHRPHIAPLAPPKEDKDPTEGHFMLLTAGHAPRGSLLSSWRRRRRRQGDRQDPLAGDAWQPVLKGRVSPGTLLDLSASSCQWPSLTHSSPGRCLPRGCVLSLPQRRHLTRPAQPPSPAVAGWATVSCSCCLQGGHPLGEGAPGGPHGEGGRARLLGAKLAGDSPGVSGAPAAYRFRPLAGSWDWPLGDLGRVTLLAQWWRWQQGRGAAAGGHPAPKQSEGR